MINRNYSDDWAAVSHDLRCVLKISPAADFNDKIISVVCRAPGPLEMFLTQLQTVGASMAIGVCSMFVLLHIVLVSPSVSYGRSWSSVHTKPADIDSLMAIIDKQGQTVAASVIFEQAASAKSAPQALYSKPEIKPLTSIPGRTVTNYV